jgi:hypothetical protein
LRLIRSAVQPGRKTAFLKLKMRVSAAFQGSLFDGALHGFN